MTGTISQKRRDVRFMSAGYITRRGKKESDTGGKNGGRNGRGGWTHLMEGLEYESYKSSWGHPISGEYPSLGGPGRP